MSSCPKVLDLDIVSSVMKRPYHDHGDSLVCGRVLSEGGSLAIA